MRDEQNQDPMLGDDASQKSYMSELLDKAQQEIESHRQARRAQYGIPQDTPPVIIGTIGFGGGISAVSE